MNEAVYEIQQYLRNISRYDTDIPTVIPDGIFGSETTESVKLFQNKHNLSASGKVDFETWEKLVSENRKALLFFSEPLPTAPSKNKDFPLREDKESHLNSKLNLMLSHFSDFYDNFTSIRPSKDYTKQTTEQVKVFQRITGYEPDGQTDKELWNLISSLYLILHPDNK